MPSRAHHGLCSSASTPTGSRAICCLLLVLSACAAHADGVAAPAGGGGHAIESSQLGASSARMSGTVDPGLRLHGIAGQSGDATLQGGAVRLEGGFLHRLPLADGLFRDGFEDAQP